MVTAAFQDRLRLQDPAREVLGKIPEEQLRFVQADEASPRLHDPDITHLIYWEDTYLTFRVAGDSTLEFWLAGTDSGGFEVYWYTNHPDDGPTIGRAATGVTFTRSDCRGLLGLQLH